MKKNYLLSRTLSDTGLILATKIFSKKFTFCKQNTKCNYWKIAFILFFSVPLYFFAQTKNVPNTGSNVYKTCSGTLYDNGGSAGNYVNNSDGYTVITPSTAVSLSRVSGLLKSEYDYDFLEIYDGVGIDGTLLYRESGSRTVPTITSLSGSLTVRFTSNGRWNYSGFALEVSCFTPTPCSGTPNSTTPSNTYIKSFKFVGTLNNPQLAANTSTNSTGGYEDYTSLTARAMQPDGQVLNVEAASNVTANWKAYVDFNKDGKFNFDERVYSLTNSYTNALTFGFIIPAGTPPGNYRFRLIASNDAGDAQFDACNNTSNKFEIEDYLFQVVYNSPIKVSAINVNPTDGHRCGTGAVTLSATGNGTGFKWYTTLTGGTSIATGSTFTTDPLSASTTYYVTATTNSDETAFRVPVLARIDPLPTITFSSTPSFCGVANVGLTVTGSGDKYTDTKLDEKFDTTLKFTNFNLGNYTQEIGNWLNKPSPYIPLSTVQGGQYAGLSPAISSGYFGGNYAMINTDISRKTPINNALTLNTGIDLRGFQNLYLDFDSYFYTITSEATQCNFKIQFSKDNGVTWNTLETITSIQGNPFVWAKKSYFIPYDIMPDIPNNIPGSYNTTKFKVRFAIYADAYTYGDNNAFFYESIATVDNIKIYGEKPITSGFTWTDPGSLIYEKTCTSLLGSAKTDQICIKPAPSQIENDPSWTIKATAAFSNGCDATNSIVVPNNTNTWNTTASTDWNSASHWKPNTLVPDNTKCVIIKQPVILGKTTTGAAKNLTVQDAGNLSIAGSLTVTDFVQNKTNNADKLTVESDGNLIQQNAIVSNVGSITAKRNTVALRYNPGTVIDYVYWGSPVKGQITKGNAAGAFSPGTPLSEFLSYRESNDRFYETADLTFTPGRGYAVQAEGIAGKTYTFKGEPNNGDISYPIIRSPDSGGYVHGYNLVANPYPSNITFEELYKGNSDLIYNTAWFWTNNIYEAVQKGSGYNGNNYSVINGTGSVSSTYSTYSGNVTSNGTITVGQGFIVQAKTSGSLVFKNTYGPGHILRVGDAGVGFFKKGTAQKDRFWLNLTNPDNITNAQLIGYVEGATDGFEQDYDNEAFDDYSDLFYSKLNNMKLVIQGKSQNFSSDDRIQLGAIISQTGNYTIALDKAEGIFRNDQKIYLKDKENGIVTDLSMSDYSFQATKGLSEGRFEIIYKPQSVLSTADLIKENLWIYREANNFVVKSAQKILEIEMYDYAGRLLVKVQPLSTSSKIAADSLPNGIYLLKIKLANGETITKKIRK